MDISNNQLKLLGLTMKLNISYDELRAQILENAAIKDNAAENEVYYKLTPAELMNYSEGKEQYVIVNLADKIYVKPEDAQNYVSASNLMQFLGSYGIVDYDQLQESYDKLFSTVEGNEGFAFKLSKLQEEKPSAEEGYWSEPINTTEQKVYATMYDRVAATLNNIASTTCSCVFFAISSMLSYADAMSVTDQEIYDIAIENFGFNQGDLDGTSKVNNEQVPIEVPEVAAPQIEENIPVESIVEEPIADEPAVQAPAVEESASTQRSINADNEAVAETSWAGYVPQKTKPENIDIKQDAQPVRTDFTTSIGQTLNIPVRNVVVNAVYEDGSSASNRTNAANSSFVLDDSGLRADKSQINNKISNLRTKMYAATRLERLNTDTPMEAGLTDLSGLSTAAQRLFSNYIIDENGNYMLSGDGERQLKSLRQKIVDTYYIAVNYISLGIQQGEVKDNPGNIKNNETDTTVRGAIKSVEKDIQLAFGAESFNLDKYKADYAVWADQYAELSSAYDAEYAKLQSMQEPEDTEQALWYTNLWNAMGGENTRLGEDVQMNVVKSGASHGHAHGSYSNELRREFEIPQKTNYKQEGRFMVLGEERMDDEAWLKESLKNGDIRLEKYVTKKPQNYKEVNYIDNTPTVHQRTGESSMKELEDLKKLTQPQKGFENFM